MCLFIYLFIYFYCWGRMLVYYLRYRKFYLQLGKSNIFLSDFASDV